MALIEAGLRNPVIRVRNMAVRAIAHWPADAWPEQAAGALAACAADEPNDETRQAILDALSSHEVPS